MSLLHLLETAIRDPRKIAKVATSPESRHHVGQELNKSIHSRFGQRQENPNGIDIFSEDWDNLIILDACRYDAMESAINRHELPWELESRVSKGSQTPEWLYANFANRQLHDVVYVSASAMPHHLGVQEPQTARQHKYGFELDIHDLIDVWADPPESAIETYVDRNEVDIVLPAESMIQPSVEAVQKYPNKRVIVHMIQPHDPYWGETGRELHEESASPWHDKLRGDIDVPVEKLREAYRENVDIAVDAASTIAQQLPGKTVVSSDHGEYLYGRSRPIPIQEILHPDRTYTDTLVKVPWIEIETGDRRETNSDLPEQQSLKQERRGKTDEQLEALGYI